jgi:hypothetical protein
MLASTQAVHSKVPRPLSKSAGCQAGAKRHIQKAWAPPKNSSGAQGAIGRGWQALSIVLAGRSHRRRRRAFMVHLSLLAVIFV